jgi:hypothetical protein
MKNHLSLLINVSERFDWGWRPIMVLWKTLATHLALLANWMFAGCWLFTPILINYFEGASKGYQLGHFYGTILPVFISCPFWERSHWLFFNKCYILHLSLEAMAPT